MVSKKFQLIVLILISWQSFALTRVINSSVIMDLWSRNIDWAELVDNGPKEFTIQNEKITVKLEHQLTKDNQRQNNKEINDVEVFRESKESSREHSISEVIYMGNGWEIIIKNPKLNSCY